MELGNRFLARYRKYHAQLVLSMPDLKTFAIKAYVIPIFTDITTCRHTEKGELNQYWYSPATITVLVEVCHVVYLLAQTCSAQPARMHSPQVQLKITDATTPCALHPSGAFDSLQESCLFVNS